MLIMRGSLAHTHFRLERLLTHIHSIVPQVNGLHAEFVYFIDIKGDISKGESHILSNLLSDTGYSTETSSEILKETFILIVPKPGMMSSWSSEATDIAKICGLNQVQRIERGIVYTFEASEKLTWGDEQAIATLLYDPQSETVFYRFLELENLFRGSETLRIESASDKSAKPKAEFSGFSVLNLHIPKFLQPWEFHFETSIEKLSSLETMLDMPQHFSQFNNERGCPTLCGYFRTYEPSISDSKINLNKITLEEAVSRLLRLPCIADKSFLITIADRSATGLVVRDPMVGPWQVPVADCAVTAQGLDTYQGKAMAIGERTPLAMINPGASVRMAVGEAITNIAGAQIEFLSEIRLEALNVDEALKAPTLELCQTLGIDIAINQNQDFGSLPIVQACAPLKDVRFVLTPLLTVNGDETLLIFIDLSHGRQRLGGSAIAQVFNQGGEEVPDVDNPNLLRSFFTTLQKLHTEGKILAYHDRSDGGLFITLCEMAFASHVGLKIDISELGLDSKSILFNEELGVVIQIRTRDAGSILAELEDSEVSNYYMIGQLDTTDQISIIFHQEVIFSDDRIHLQEMWSETSFHLQSIRDNPRCAKKQYELIKDREDPGLSSVLTFDLAEDITDCFLNLGARPRVAILREQGAHGQIEMAAAFDRAQFDCVDVYMNDLQKGIFKLKDFKGLAVCGGFSFKDVLGAGQGWAKRILLNEPLKEQFETFFNRCDTFTVGFSNGCQMLSHLKTLIPGALLWPHFVQNYSEQFEARLCLVEVQNTASIFLKDMEGSRLLVPVAHKEGRVEFSREEIQEEVLKQGLVALRYVDNWGRKTKTYPANPNGSALGITGLTTPDGRVLIMMPHPDRAFRSIQYSWRPEGWGEDAPWLRLFRNARKWIG